MTPENEKMLAAAAQAFCDDKGLRFVELAGHGAFKATYRVVDSAGKTIALKVYLPGSVNERTSREIDALVALSKTGHQSLPCFLAVIAFHHAGVDFLFSAEEFLEGGSLTEFVRTQGLLDRNRLIRLALEVSSALIEVAGAHLVHRDVKPDNIVLRVDGTAVLVDFGLVRNLAQLSLTQSWLAQGPGTPLFASPEQLNNDKHIIDWRTDQFSLGVSLAFCGFGNHPYAHPGDTPDQIVARVGSRAPVHPGFVQWATSSGLTPLVKMVESWPAARYRTSSSLQVAWTSL